MREPKGKRIMKNRRQFLIDNVSAWFLAPELANRIEWVASHEKKPYLPKVIHPRETLYATNDYGGYYLSLNTPYNEDEPGQITWADYFDANCVDINDTRAVLDWAEESGRHNPDEGDLFSIPDPDEEVDYTALEDYIEGSWCLNSSASAQAFHYLSSLDLGPSNPGDGEPLGRLELAQGPCPGSNATYAIAECEQTLSCLQHRLLELGENVKIRITN
jgi:hypothetical protein